MTDDDQPVPDDELAALLRRVSNDLTLQPQYRDRARAAMFAEFDAIVADTGTADSKEHLSVVPAIELDEERRRPSSRSFVSGWAAVAAACLLVLTLVVVANLRNVSTTSDATDPSVPRTPDHASRRRGPGSAAHLGVSADRAGRCDVSNR